MPDALRDEPPAGAGPDAPPDTTAAAPPAAPPIAAPADSGHPARRPSWLHAALWSLVVLTAGVALGGAGYRLEHRYLIPAPRVERTAAGLRIEAQAGHELTGVALDGTRLLWQDGASIEYLDTRKAKILLLGPGAGMRTTWEPAVSDRFAVWFEAERQVSLAARMVVYDTVSGRRRTLGDVGSVRSFPALSGDLAVWCSAVRLGHPRILGARVGGGGQLIPMADGDGAPVVSGGLVAWAAGWTGPFYAEEVASGTRWPVTASLTDGRLTGLALSGRTLVWGQESKESGSGVVAAVDVDGGSQQTVASGIKGLVGPSFDGSTVVWAEKTTHGTRVMARRLGGPAVEVSRWPGAITGVAVSGASVAWIERDQGVWYTIEVRSLPR